MELKVWVEGIQRVVCGLNDASTCQDVVLVLAHAIGRTGRFTLVERWRDTERLISPTENPLHVLQKWGEYAHDVKFILRWSDGSDETPAKGHALEPNHGTASGSKRTEGFLHNFSPHKTPEKPQNNVEQKNASSIKKSYTFSGARRPFSGDSRKTASGRAGHDLISENASSLDSYDEDLSPPSSNSSPYSSIRSTNGSQQQNGDDHNHFLNHHHHMDNRYHQHNNHYHQSQQQHNNHSRSSSNASASTGPSVTGSGSSVHSPHSSITDRHHHRSPARPPAYNKPSFVNGTTVISSQDTSPMSKLTIADSAYTSASSASSPARSSGSSNGSGRGMSRGGAGNGTPGSVGMTPQRTRGAPPPYKPPPPSYKSNGFYSSRNKPADTRQVAAEEYKLEDNLVSSDRTHEHTPTANRHKTDYGDRLTNRVEGYSDSPSHKQDYSSTTNHRRELSDSANHRWERDESANRSAHHRREEAVGDDSSAIEERQELMRLVQLQREKLSKQNTTISELEAKLQADCSIEVTEDNLLDDEISRLTSQINELTVRSDGYEKELQELQLSSWEDKLRIEKQQESMLHSEIKLLQSQIATAKSDLEQQISQQMHLTEELETLNKERDKSRNSEQLAQRQTSEKQDQLEKVNKELTSKRQSLEEIEKEMMDLEEQLATRELQITQLERNVRQDNLQVFCADNNLSLLNSSDEPSPSPGRSPAHRPSSARKMTYSPQMMKNTYNPGGYLV